ncbi:MAG: hypothetical protein EP338_13250 [Bacteroidetes bacterium]|nr:MAG: hypothetical protein EP338_13250 [Bacteroidota bacterium]
MTREQRTLAISLLTVFLLALSNYLNQGVFIFTFPINEYLFLVVSLYFSWFHWKQEKWIYSLLVLLGICQLFSETYNLELIASSETLVWYEQTAIRDWLKIVSQLIILVISARILKSEYKQHFWITISVLIGITILGLVLSNAWILQASLFLIVFLTGLRREKRATHLDAVYYALLLLLILNYTKLLYISF